MQLEVGDILNGSVTGIMKYGVFVEIGEGVSGMVHISEIANVYVKEISDHVSVGQQVSVKVIGIDERGKISLSMKQAADTSQGAQGAHTAQGSSGSHAARGTNNSGSKGGFGGAAGNDGYRHNRNSSGGRGGYASSQGKRGGYAEDIITDPSGDGDPQDGVVRKTSGNKNFDDMLSRFMQSSNEKIGGLKKSGDHRPRRGNRK